ncbi:putative nitroreductase using NADPH [Blattamonas nauphoetae]|uniref:Nitroreductase using NADPH n=1 Tax=Blattamonas nauphoetae TaxID=2049346 RepID=A0ABQ9XB41_9EUKA|nr:putative nitroreductase using NADPH [Blattamonas nauphoetae]
MFLTIELLLVGSPLNFTPTLHLNLCFVERINNIPAAMTTTTDMRNTLIQYLIEFIVVFIANKANISRVDGFFSRLIFLVCSIIAVALFNTVFKLYQQSKMVSRKEKKLSEARTYSMFELAMTRSSVRNFDPDRRIEDSVFKTLQEWCEDPANITGPFGSRITLKVFRADETVNGKVGTYGAIKNASCFVVGLKDDKTSIPDFGYVFEKFVLFCTKQQLGTCWMAATFDFKTIPTKETITSRFSKRMGGASFRKPFNTFALKDSIKSTTSYDNYSDIPRLSKALQAAHWSPSATNGQPTKIVISESNGKFNLRFYEKKTILWYHPVDGGIVLCNFAEVAKDEGIAGQLLFESDVESESSFTYVGTWKEL